MYTIQHAQKISSRPPVGSDTPFTSHQNSKQPGRAGASSRCYLGQLIADSLSASQNQFCALGDVGGRRSVIYDIFLAVSEDDT